MNKTLFCSISDDRFGRKGGVYEETQKKVTEILIRNEFFDFIQVWNIRDVLNQKEFYEENKIMLDNEDPARNGRLYKPFIIQQSLKTIEYGDYLIYNDVSPEMWKMDDDFIIDKDIYDVEIINNLCRKSSDFLVAFVKWSPTDFIEKPLGIHTHRYFTLTNCIDVMDAWNYIDSFLCASGMICMRKTKETEKLINEWLEWNKNYIAACIGYPDIPNDESFWNHKEEYKLGIRHDQSILSILLNKRNWDFVDIVYNDISPYNFLNFCRKDHDYQFINSNIK